MQLASGYSLPYIHSRSDSSASVLRESVWRPRTSRSVHLDSRTVVNEGNGVRIGTDLSFTIAPYLSQIEIYQDPELIQIPVLRAVDAQGAGH